MKPTPEFQLEFLNKIQRLFSEGDFTATYKFALLISLADLAVERGSDDSSPLALPLNAIGLKFIQLYWQQSAPYKGQEQLAQNLGAKAAVLKNLEEYRRVHRTLSPQSPMELKDFQRLLAKVTQTVRDQPIQFIQNLPGGRNEFLFQIEKDAVALLPGVAFCLRRFQPLIQQLSRSHWINHIKGNRRNSLILGSDSDLEAFLFETPRQALTSVAGDLRKINNRCHYCARSVQEADVDHFIPHAMYPRDLMHNFVLAHPTCNRSKSDTLAAKPHLQKWMEFVQTNNDNLAQIGYDAGINVDYQSTSAVAQWGYTNAASNGSHAWLRSAEYESIDSTYLSLWK